MIGTPSTHRGVVIAAMVIAGAGTAQLHAQETSRLRLGFLAGGVFIPHDVSLSANEPAPFDNFNGQGSGSFNPRGVGGLELGYRLSGRLEVEGYALRTQLFAPVLFMLSQPPPGLPFGPVLPLRAKAGIWLWGVNGNVFLRTRGRFQPFVSGGIGAVAYLGGGIADNLTSTVGMGLAIPLARHWSVRTVFRDVLSTYSGLQRFSFLLDGTTDLGGGLKNQFLLGTGVSFHF